MVSYVVLAADLETVADTSNASEGDGSASDIVLLVALIDAAVERLEIGRAHV